MESRIRLFVVLICTLSSFSSAHNWLDTPVSRANQQQSQTGCRVGGEGSPNCPGPCDRNISKITQAPIFVQRGQTLDVKWNMHNHPGGFVRLAWCPTSQSDSHACFDANVQQYTCKQHGGCSESNPLCSTTISAPTFLSDGAWTLQWAYFGGYFQAGDYYACVDYQVSGGASVSAKSSPTFVGGDTTQPNSNTCLFYNTDALHVCVVEPCTTGTYPTGIVQRGFPSAMNNIAQSSTTGVNRAYTTGSSQPVTTGRLTPATTAAVTPATTGAVKFATTGSASPFTTGKPSPLTTGLKFLTTADSTPYTTGARPTLTTDSKGYTTDSCTSGHMKCLSQQSFSTCSWGVWQAAQSCASGTVCSPSGDYIYCIAGSTPATPSPVPSTPYTTSPAQVIPSTTGSSSSGCTFGYQRCSSTNSYQTCTYGQNGFVWSQSQSCQSGLSCHTSSTANNIYCY